MSDENTERRKGRWRLLAVLSLAAAICVGLSYFLVDIPAARFARSLRGGVADFFQIVTRLGVSTWYLVFSFALFLFFRFVRKNDLLSKRCLFIFLCVGASGLVTDLLKMLFGRCRPKVFFLNGLYGFQFFRTGYDFTSFPSGHATTVGALTAALWLLYPRYGIVYAVLAVLALASRVIVEAHFVSDVIAGAYVGTVTAVLLKRFFEARGVTLRDPADAGGLVE